MKFRWLLLLPMCLFQQCTQKSTDGKEGREIWTTDQAQEWQEKQGWLVGANFLPSTAINQLEMWQAETFDTATIDREVGWAEGLGMNTLRVYLHDILYQQDSTGFFDRMNIFLEICDRHHIKPMFVIFDSCWDPFPYPGKQRAPKPFVHNSGWVQSPGQRILADSTQYGKLEKYVKAVIGRFATDDRIVAWDLWNEPDNMTGPSYEKVEIPNKVDLVLPLLEKTFHWARTMNPSQPLTSGVWAGDWSSDETLKPIEKLQLTQSDIITFHNYSEPGDLESRIVQLQRYGRPMVCTEYMARPNGSTFEGCLPVGKKYHVGMINWGFVSGKSQTIYPWDSWTRQYNSEPPLWFHDIFRKDGSPYKAKEVAIIKEMTSTEASTD